MKNKILRLLGFIIFFLISALHLGAQIAKDNCKFLGNVIAGSVPADFNKYWNQVTPENSGKWGSVESTQDEMNWDQLDLAYEYAKSKNFLFKQHTFVWGQQQPEWISSLSSANQKIEVEAWIQSYCERYPDTDFIDVVNEPLHAVPSYSAALGGNGSTGWDWVIWAFEKAREYCPNAKLILNDYNILNNNSATNQYLQIINLLKERNLIDVIGEQGHFLETTPSETILANLNKFYATGLPIQISEYDVNLSNDTEQKNKYEEQFELLWSHPGVKGITLWGYRQGAIWQANAYLVRSNSTERPALTWMKGYVAETTGEDFCLVTAIREEDTRVKLYPNPSSGDFTLEGIRGESDLEIFNAQGSMVKRMTLKGSRPLSFNPKLNAGMYFFRVSSQSNQNLMRVVIR